jgi:hypothetical protein
VGGEEGGVEVEVEAGGWGGDEVGGEEGVCGGGWSGEDGVAGLGEVDAGVEAAEGGGLEEGVV